MKPQHSTRPVEEDRRDDRQTWALDHLPGGRGHGAACVVRADPRSDCGAAPITTASPIVSAAAITGRTDCRQGNCVQMQAGRAEIASERRTHRNHMANSAITRPQALIAAGNRTYRSPQMPGCAGYNLICPRSIMGPSNRLMGFGVPGAAAPKPKIGPPLPRGLLSETSEETDKRRAEVRSLIREVFKVAVAHLGEQDARAARTDAAKGQRGRKRGTSNADRDSRLLTFYDDVARSLNDQDRKVIPRLLAKYVKENHGAMFPAAESSIETHIRRLLKQRLARERANNAIYAQLLLQGSGPPGLLGSLIGDAKADPGPAKPGETKNPGD